MAQCSDQLFTKQQNFRLVQIGSICRRQKKCNSKQKFFLGWVENIVGKRENAGYFFPQGH